MKMVVLDGYTENPGDLSWDEMKALCDEFTLYDRTNRDQVKEIIDRIGDAELVITNKTPMTEEIFAACPQIKYLGVIATGYNVVDLEAAKKRGIPVTNIPTYGTSAVSQYAMALLLEVCHHIGHHNNAVHEGRWENCIDFCFWDYPLMELEGKTMGVIGFGRIGQATAKLAQAFGMKVLAYDAFPNKELESDSCRYASLEEIYQAADVISLHCPLFPQTQGMINKENIAKMKDGVIIINTSRGPLIVEEDLKEALNSGKVAAAAVDVVSTEPIRGDNPLLQAKNCIITPHIAWASRESRQRLMDIAVDNVKAFLAGNPINVVNK